MLNMKSPELPKKYRLLSEQTLGIAIANISY